MRKIVMISIALLFTISLNGCKGAVTPITSPTPTAVQVKTPAKVSPVVPVNVNSTIIYENTQYGFRFTLPMSWKGYSIVNGKWDGVALIGPKSGKVIETGKIIYIRHPQWTAKVLRQDIPIMIFTLGQWKSLQKEEFSVGAAPIPPSELGRNSRYVFALPARYNYAFPKGYQEVENILKGNPLQPIEEYK
jgi:hypothetical protein